MINNSFIFYTASILLIIFLLMSLLFKNTIYSLLSAIVVFYLSALLFYTLGSEYNAIIQACVYGFAVPIILGVSIMFTNNTKKDAKKPFILPYFAILCTGIFIMAFVYLIKISLAIMPDTFHLNNSVIINHYDVMTAFAKGIFIDYVWAFELLSILLTVVIAGLTIFRRRGA